MASPYIMRKNSNILADLVDGPQAMGLGIGNVYYVMQTGQSFYNQFVDDYQREYSDGTLAVHSTIQSGLNACTAERNDYVIVYPDGSDYDLTTALTMTKSHVHLICPAGLGSGGIPSNAARVHQTDSDSTSYHIVVTANTIEIAGFFFKSDSTSRYSQIHLSGTRWHANIHDNFFGMSATASSNINGVLGDGACGHMTIHHNWFSNYNPGAMTGTDNDITAFANLSSNSSTRNLIADNIFCTGANTAVATGVNQAGDQGLVLRNYFYEDQALGGVADAGSFTVAINISSQTMAADNRVSMATAANASQGGTNNVSWVTNYYGASGGTLTSDSTA